jgi:hypothetical protein
MTNQPDQPDTQTIRAVIKPPKDHPNHVSGERLPVTILIEDPYPWHEPWEGWTIAEVLAARPAATDTAREALDEAWQQYGYLASASLSAEDKDVAFRKLGSILAAALQATEEPPTRCPRCEGYEATYHTFEGECSQRPAMEEPA